MRRAQRSSGLSLVLLALSTLAACNFMPRGGGYFEDDGPGGSIRDASRIPDAVPRREPLNSAANRPYTVSGVTYYPLADARGYHERGIASWYGRKFHGKRTSTGEPYDMYAMTAAHKTLPLPCYVRVRNLENGRSVIVRVNDRGPFLRNRLIDLSYAAADKLGIVATGTGIVDVETVEPGYAPPPRERIMTAESATAPHLMEERKSAASRDTGSARGPRLDPIAGAQATPAAESPAKPSGVEIFPAAQAATVAAAPVAAEGPTLYLQVGAFAQWDNAAALRTRLEQAALRPIFIQSVLAPGANGGAEQRIYRVRVGPITNVEEGDRLTERAAQLGVPNARIVVE